MVKGRNERRAKEGNPELEGKIKGRLEREMVKIRASARNEELKGRKLRAYCHEGD
jgi:hypothetical protein